MKHSIQKTIQIVNTSTGEMYVISLDERPFASNIGYNNDNNLDLNHIALTIYDRGGKRIDRIVLEKQLVVSTAKTVLKI